jgi:pyridoxal 5'-phosphate synthase pdxS subunit
MADPTSNGTPSFSEPALRLKLGLAEMLKGGVIMDVMNVEQARIAEEAGAISVMALERVPAMIRAEGGVARMANPKLIREIMAAVTIPVMAKARIGHFAEAQILQHLGVDFIDESEVLTPADETYHIDKHAFTTPFVCGARNLGEALRRIAEGAAMIRTKGEPGTGDVVHAVRHMRQIVSEIKALTVLSDQELYNAAKVHGAPYELVRMVAKSGSLPVPNFSAGGIATPADAALMMQLGAESIFVGSGIFMKERATPLEVGLYEEGDVYKDGDWYWVKIKGEWQPDVPIVRSNFGKPIDPSLIGQPRNPEERVEAISRARAIVIATTHFADAKIVADAAETVTGTMKGLAAAAIEEKDLMQTRGW